MANVIATTLEESLSVQPGHHFRVASERQSSRNIVDAKRTTANIDAKRTAAVVKPVRHTALVESDHHLSTHRGYSTLLGAPAPMYTANPSCTILQLRKQQPKQQPKQQQLQQQVQQPKHEIHASHGAQRRNCIGD
eukprot:m.473410 g.473410  ORF g.473410 m.473410 type:complete len:135 (+) comp34305_c0_seq1:464-868(+)